MKPITLEWLQEMTCVTNISHILFVILFMIMYNKTITNQVHYFKMLYIEHIHMSAINNLSLLMRLQYLSHRRPAKAQASLHIRTVWPEPSLFAHMNFGSRLRVRPKIRHLAPLDGCACTFEECIYRGRKEL